MKKDNYEERLEHNEIGEEIHVFNSHDGEETRIKKIDPAYFIPTGEEYCPDCKCLLEHKEDYWECPKCGYSITDDESENGEGYPTLESTYEDDYNEYYPSYDDDDDDDDF